MRFYRETLGISDNAFIILRDLIHELTGIFFDDSKKDSLADKLSARVIELGFSSFLDYYYYLKYDEGSTREIRNLFNLITVNETYFYRETDALHTITDVLLPSILERKNGNPVKIWSAACSSGEEPLTLAMMLAEKGLLSDSKVQLFATDASTLAVGKAMVGEFSERSFRNCDAHFREKYFDPKDDKTMKIKQSILEFVRFSVANLNSPAEIKHFAAADIILCRNVFIYFSKKSILQTVNTFYGAMPEQAYLLLGVSESLLKFNVPFEFREINGSFVYVKENLLSKWIK